MSTESSRIHIALQILILIIVIVCLGAVAVGEAAAAPPGTDVVVDDDWRNNSTGDVVDGGYVIGTNATATVSSALDNASEGDTISVYPGTYREASGPNGAGVYVDTPNVTLRGVTEQGGVINHRENVGAEVVPESGAQAMYVDSEGVTVSGLEFTADNASEPLRNVEVTGDRFTLTRSVLPGLGGTVYVTGDEVQKFTITGSEVGILTVSNGVGDDLGRSNRIVTDNLIRVAQFAGDVSANDRWKSTYGDSPIGNVTASGNTITEAMFAYNTTTPDLRHIARQNTIRRGAIPLTPSGDVRANENEVRLVYKLPSAVAAAKPGDTVSVLPGRYAHSRTLVVDKRVSLVASGGPDTTTIAAGHGGPVVDVRASNVTVDGFTITNRSGNEPARGLTLSGPGVENVTLRNLDVSGVRNEGIVITRSDGTLVENVRVRHNDGTGLLVTGNDTTLVDVTAAGNAAHGVAVGTDGHHGRSPPASGLTVSRSTFESNGKAGLAVRGAERVTIRDSAFLGAGGVVAVNVTTPVDGGHNYWDAPTGPGGVAPGTGATVSGNVTYAPFYTNAALTTLSTDPPTLSNVTLTDVADGDGTVGDGDTLLVRARVVDPVGVANVTTNATAFGGNGSLSLTHDSDDPANVYDANVSVNLDSATGSAGNVSLTVVARDDSGGTANASTNPLTLAVPNRDDDDDDDDDDDRPSNSSRSDRVTALIIDGRADLNVGGRVSRLQIEFGSGGTGGSAAAEPLSGPPDSVPPVPDASNAAYVDVSVPQDRTAAEATLRFTVDITTFDGAAPEDLVVYHYTRGQWTALETSVVGVNGDRVTVAAATSTFSPFAVGTRNAPPERRTATPAEPAAPDGRTTTDAPSGDRTTTRAAGTTEGVETTGAPVEEPAGFNPVAVGVIVTLVFAVGFVVFRRK